MNCPILALNIAYNYEIGGNCCSCGSITIDVGDLNNDLTEYPTGYVIINGNQMDLNINNVLNYGIGLIYNTTQFYPIEIHIVYQNCYYERIINQSSLDFSTYISYTDSTPNNPCYKTEFYYPTTLNSSIIGCTNPLSSNYNPLATIDDGSCILPIFGCTNPLSSNYNPLATVDDGSCNVVISGCTNPTYVEYNPLATIDDGSCKTLNNIIGCTNPLSSNYNEFATINDGSCIFISGCTNPLSSNYNELAVIDNGTCKCGDLIIDIGEILNFDICKHVLDLDYRIVIDCEDILDYYLNNNFTILQILNRINLFLSFSGDIGVEQQKIYQFYSSLLLTDIQYIVFKGNDEKCALLKDFIRIELNQPYSYNINNHINNAWQHTANEFTISGEVQLTAIFENLGFPITLEIDNIKIKKVCTEEVYKNYTRTEGVGFEKELVVDNVKSTLDSNILIKNTKIIDLRVDAANLIDKDIEEYLISNNRVLPLKFKNFTFTKNYLNPTNLLTNDNWGLKRIKQLYHTDIFRYCNIKSKKLDSYYHLNILQNIDIKWFYFLNNFIPATTIRNKHTHYIRNIICDNIKHSYKKYVLYNGTDTVNSDAEIISNYNFEDDYNGLPYTNTIDKILTANNSCEVPLQKTVYGIYNETPYGIGRLVTYDKNSKEITDSNLNKKTIYQNC